MSLLSGLLGQARSWLSAPPKPELQEQAVRQTLFDDALFTEMREQAPQLDDLIRSLRRDYGYTEELVADTFAQMYQSAPRIRDKAEMAEPFLANHAVATNLSKAPDVAKLRGYSQHSKYGATMATIGVSDKVRQLLAEAKELQDAVEESKQKQQQAEQQDQQLDQAVQDGQAQQDALDAAQDALDDAMGEFDGNGPLTEAQAAAGDALAQAQADAALTAEQLQSLLEQAERAHEAAVAAGEQVQQEVQRVGRATRGPVNEAVEKAADDLAEEEAMFRAWGFGPGELERMSFAERAEKAQRLRNHVSKDWWQQLGRWRLMQKAKYAKKVAYAREEAYDVTNTGNLPDVLPSEFAHLGTAPGRVDFMVRLSERQLLGMKFRGTEKTGQGAVVALIDTSGSMKKTDRDGCSREVFAKGLGLSLLDSARAEGRDFVGIIFGNAEKQQVWHFPKGQGAFEDVLDFAELFFGGGTDFQVPLDLAMDIVEKQYNAEGKAQADIVLITDDDCAVTPDWLATYMERKARLDFRTFGVAVGMKKAGGTLTSLSDDVRAITEFSDPQVVGDIIEKV